MKCPQQNSPFKAALAATSVSCVLAVGLVGMQSSPAIAAVQSPSAAQAKAARSAQSTSAAKRRAAAKRAAAKRAAARRRHHRPPPPPRPAPIPPQPPAPSLTYSIDGTGNNLHAPNWGSANIALRRLTVASYADGISTPAGTNRPSARALSNALSAQTGDIENNRNMSDYVYVFGQFLDHDLSLTDTSGADFPIPIPTGDPYFDPNSTGTKTMSLTRSSFDPASGTSTSNPRQQTTSITAFIDGSEVYGSDSTRASALRAFSGGKLKTSAGNMPPFNTSGLPNANDAHIVPDNQLFLAGDVRANENPELTALHVVFLREHNRLAAALATLHPTWTDEQLFQAARQTVIGELQAITYNEFLPALLGEYGVGSYHGYDPGTNPGIANEFSTAAFRFGHSMLDGEVGRENNDGTPTPQGPLELRNAFFNPTVFDPSLPNHQGDIDPFLKAASGGIAQEIDLKIVDDVRNFLFGPPGSGGFDLAARNIQRGRDHGLPDYNTVREAYGLPKVTSFRQITSNPATRAALEAQYGSVDKIDLWVGGLAENHAYDSSLGPLFQRIVANQFARLRNGDRLYYENVLTGSDLARVRATHLSDVIKRNTSLTTLQSNIFKGTGSGGDS